MTKRMLFIGNASYGSNAASLAFGFRHNGWQVDHINTSYYESPYGLPVRRAFKKIARAEYDKYIETRLRRTVREAARRSNYDVLVGFKSLWVSSHTLASVPGAVKIHYHPDDSANPTNRSEILSEAESSWDAHVTTKSFNVKEVESRTGQPALYVKCAYDPRWHIAQGNYRWPRVGFIGTRRPDRASLIHSLSTEYGSEMSVVGLGWPRDKQLDPLTQVKPPAYGCDMARAVSAAPIQLGFLNSDNRDRHTCRTFEIPACGGLLVAERTDEHAEIFEDYRSAALFSNEEELRETLSFLNRNIDKARSIAAEGQRRIASGRNTYADRAFEIIRGFSL